MVVQKVGDCDWMTGELRKEVENNRARKGGGKGGTRGGGEGSGKVVSNKEGGKDGMS